MGLGVEQLLDDGTRLLRTDAERELASFTQIAEPAHYRSYLARLYGFVAPLERSLVDTTDLANVLDLRRFSKHKLIEADLQALGATSSELQAMPQCMWIPWFEDVHTALGWAYLVERTVLAHPGHFRHLASVLPGEAAFGAAFLKCYAGASGDMWQSFVQSVTRSISHADHEGAVVDGAKAAYRFFRRWRATLDGDALSGQQAIPSDSNEPKN